MSINEKIIALRKEKGWSQGDLAKKLGFLQPHVNRWETGKTAPSVEALKKLAKLFNISIDLLVFDETDYKKVSVKDRSLLHKLKEFDKISSRDKEAIINLIDSLQQKEAGK